MFVHRKPNKSGKINVQIVLKLELERMLKKAKSAITVKRAQELTKNMY
jgi:hypothetical protein